MTNKIMVCGHCDASGVERDAWADWDVDTQAWVLGSVFDDGHCSVCDGECSIEEVDFLVWEARQNETQVLEAKEYRAERLPSGCWKGVIADEDVGVIGELVEDWAGGTIYTRDEALDEARRAITQGKYSG